MTGTKATEWSAARDRMALRLAISAFNSWGSRERMGCCPAESPAINEWKAERYSTDRCAAKDCLDTADCWVDFFLKQAELTMAALDKAVRP